MSATALKPDGFLSGLTRGFHARRLARNTHDGHQAKKPGAPETQPDLQDILLDEPPALVRHTNLVILAIVLTMGVLASVFEVDMVVTAPGRLMADAPPLVVQPMQLSIIRELRVKPGDIVRKGDVLATLDATFTEADRASLRQQNDALQAQIQRLEAELSDLPLQLSGDSDDRRLQLKLYSERRMQHDTRLQAFDEDIARYKSNIEATERTRASLSQQLGIAREVEDMRDQLYRRQVGTKLNYLDASVVRLRTERENQDAGTRLTELRHQLATRVVERQIFVDDWRRQSLDELVRARKDAGAVGESLVKAEKLNELVTLKAPQDGVVLEVAKKSAGSVLQGAETLVSMVPMQAALVAEVMVNSSDLGYLRLGDEVAIKVDAFPYQRHGLLKGTLRAIGEDSQQAAGGLFHRSQITIDPASLHDLPSGSRIIPGMSLSAEVKVGSRTLMSYFAYPLRKGLNESLREP